MDLKCGPSPVGCMRVQPRNIHRRVSTIQHMKHLLLLAAVLLLAVHCDDQGARRMRELRELTNAAPNNIIPADSRTFNEYVLKYPRPYDVVLYFTSQNCKLCKDLYPEYEFLTSLYFKAGTTEQPKNPTFFMEIGFSSDTNDIYRMFGFTTAPNLVVSKPKMAVVSETARAAYLQSFKWSISYSDGHVTTHKMLEFVNKRTGKDVIYKPTPVMMLTTLSVFLLVCVAGVFIYTQLRSFWMKWQVWFAGVLVIYITCVSGVVYDVIHDVPFVGVDSKGEAVIFSGGNREQYGAEGLVVSLIVSLIGVLLILIPFVYQKLDQYSARVVSLVFLALIIVLVSTIEGHYKAKGWYNPMWNPPGDYQKGPFTLDQGNNI